MNSMTALAAEPRDKSGKGAARASRRNGRVPGIIYGNKVAPVLISVDPIDLNKQIRTTGFFARVYEVDVKGEKYRVLARDLQLDPVSEQPVHVDFMQFNKTTRVNVDVQVDFQNEDICSGIRMGGVLNVVRFAVELKCRPDNIPERLVADLSGLEIGDSIHISSIELPEDVELTITDRDFTIATIAAPTIIEEETSEDAAGDAASGGEAVASGDETKGEKGSAEDDSAA